MISTFKNSLFSAPKSNVYGGAEISISRKNFRVFKLKFEQSDLFNAIGLKDEKYGYGY